MLRKIQQVNKPKIKYFYRRGVLQYAPTSGFYSPSQTLGVIIRGFKSGVTKHINIFRNTPKQHVWQ